MVRFPRPRRGPRGSVDRLCPSSMRAVHLPFMQLIGYEDTPVWKTGVSTRWRRRGDLNPRWALGPHFISSEAHSAALARLQLPWQTHAASLSRLPTTGCFRQNRFRTGGRSELPRGTHRTSRACELTGGCRRHRHGRPPGPRGTTPGPLPAPSSGLPFSVPAPAPRGHRSWPSRSAPAGTGRLRAAGGKGRRS